jgi:LacI family transcriptional regulator
MIMALGIAGQVYCRDQGLSRREMKVTPGLSRARDPVSSASAARRPSTPSAPSPSSTNVEESRADGLLLATALRIPQHAGGVPAVPHVYVNRRGPDRGNDVVMDEPGAVRLFLDYVTGLGHRSVVLIDGPPEVDTVHRRVSAARRICAARGIQLTVRHEAPTEEGGWRAVTRLPGPGALPTACAVGSLNQLFGALAALRHAGIGVPSQMSVVSFDEDECLPFLDVPVTSVAMPLADLGSAAVDALIARIEREPAIDVMVRQPMSLIPRGSVTHPPRP